MTNLMEESIFLFLIVLNFKENCKNNISRRVNLTFLLLMKTFVKMLIQHFVLLQLICSNIHYNKSVGTPCYKEVGAVLWVG